MHTTCEGTDLKSICVLTGIDYYTSGNMTAEHTPNRRWRESWKAFWVVSLNRILVSVSSWCSGHSKHTRMQMHFRDMSSMDMFLSEPAGQYSQRESSESTSCLTTLKPTHPDWLICTNTCAFPLMILSHTHISTAETPSATQICHNTLTLHSIDIYVPTCSITHTHWANSYTNTMNWTLSL